MLSKEVKWHNIQFARQTVGKASEIGSLTISYCCNGCKHVPKDDCVWFCVEDGFHNTKATERMVGTSCANCGKECVTVQPSEDASKSVVFVAGMSAPGVTSTTLSVLTLATDVHVHWGHRGEADRLTANAHKALAKARKQFMKDEGDEKITTLVEISEQISSKGKFAQAQQVGTLLLTRGSGRPHLEESASRGLEEKSLGPCIDTQATWLRADSGTSPALERL